MAARRANPERTLEAILNSKDRPQALERLTRALHDTWAAGRNTGWRDGVADATEDEPTTTPNPYDKEEG